MSRWRCVTRFGDSPSPPDCTQLWWYLLIVTNDRPVRPGGVIAATPDRNAGNVYKYHQMLSTAIDIIYIYL